MAKPRVPKEYLGAFKAGHRKSAREFIDEELSYALLQRIVDSGGLDEDAKRELAYITKFNNEFHKAAFVKDEPALHCTSDLKKSCYDRNNARNRDELSIRGDTLLRLGDGLDYAQKNACVLCLDVYSYAPPPGADYEDLYLDLMVAARKLASGPNF